MDTGPRVTQIPAPPRFAAISASSSGDNTIVALSANRRIKVLAYDLIAAGNVTITWKSSVAGAISGPKVLPAAGWGLAKGYNPAGHLQTAKGEALVLNLSGAVSVGGELTYILISD